MINRIKYKATFPRDVLSSSVQKNLSSFTRIGIIQSVDPINGTCIIKWADHPGVRLDVILTQAAAGEWHIPPVGAVVLIAFDQYERARILRYINLGQASKITNKITLPKLKEGEKLWEGPNGSYLYMKLNGDIVLATASQGFITLENGNNMFTTESANWKVATDGGLGYLGIVKRMVPDPITGYSNSKVIIDSSGNSYIEYHLQILEFSDGAVGITGVSNPIVDITLGTKVDVNGVLEDKNGNLAATPNKQLTASVVFSNGVSFVMDKEGRVTINAKSINFNNGSVDATDPDIALGLEQNDATLGARGQHVAREHDIVNVPLTVNYDDPNHLSIATAAASNLIALQYLAKSFISPAGPCAFNPTIIPASSSLQGIITIGANSVVLGDS